jgi:hypothetical protein
VSSLRHVIALVAAAAVTLLACNAITGTGKYELVDCPSGSCGDGGGSSGASGSGGVPGTDGSSPTGADSGSDSATTPPITCGPGLAPVTLTVTGSGGSVSAHSGGNLSASAGMTESACLTIGTVELRTSGSTADWTGPSCKDGNSGVDRCELQLQAAGVAVTAALR